MDDLELFISSGGQATKDRRAADFRIPASVQAQRDAEAERLKSGEKNGYAGFIPTSAVVAGSQASTDPLEDYIRSGGGPDASARKVDQPAGRGPSPVGTTGQNLAAGFGKGFMDMARGAKQLTDIPAQWLEEKFPGVSSWAESHGMPSAKASAAQTNRGVAESKVLDKPLMDTTSGALGNLAGQVAGLAIPAGAVGKAGVVANPTTYKAAATVGALQGALTPVTGDESRAQNVAIQAGSLMAGNALGNLVGRVAQPVAATASNLHKKAVDVLERAGIPLDAAQRSGSAFLNRIRSGFTDNPFTAGAQRALAATQQQGFNRAVLKTIGENADAATPQVMGEAEKRINGTFKRILDNNNVHINDTVLNRMGQVQAAAAESEKRPVVSIANRIIDGVESDGTIKGQVAYGIKKDLDRLANSADTDLAYHARQLRSTLMDAINGSLDKADRAAFSEARGQFANMKKIESTIDKNGGGDISPARLANVMGQKRNRSASVYGKGPQELVDLAHSGNMLLGDKMPNSGTASRLMGQAALPILGAYSGARYGDEPGAGIGAAAGLLAGKYAPRVAQMAMQNPALSRYVSEGMQGGMTPLRNILMAPNTNPLIGGMVRRVPPAMIPLSAVAEDSRK